MYVIQQCGLQAQNSDNHLNTEKNENEDISTGFAEDSY